MAWIVISIGWKVIRWTPIFIVLPTGNGTGASWESVFCNSLRSILKHREPRVTNAEIIGTRVTSVAVRIIFLVSVESRDENGIIRSLIEVVYLLFCSSSGNLLIIVCWKFFLFFFLNLLLRGRLNSLLRGKTTLSLGFGEGLGVFCRLRECSCWLFFLWYVGFIIANDIICLFRSTLLQFLRLVGLCLLNLLLLIFIG